jgi:hypothetical protein
VANASSRDWNMYPLLQSSGSTTSLAPSLTARSINAMLCPTLASTLPIAGCI